MITALLPPVVLILEQPDLSTAIIVIWIFLCMLFMGGLDYKMIARACMLAVLICGLGLFFITRPGQKLLNDYQYRRIMAWLSPQEWAQDSYQQRNSIMAIGSGGLLRAKDMTGRLICIGMAALIAGQALHYSNSNCKNSRNFLAGLEKI